MYIRNPKLRRAMLGGYVTKYLDHDKLEKKQRRDDEKIASETAMDDVEVPVQLYVVQVHRDNTATISVVPVDEVPKDEEEFKQEDDG